MQTYQIMYVRIVLEIFLVFPSDFAKLLFRFVFMARIVCGDKTLDADNSQYCKLRSVSSGAIDGYIRAECAHCKFIQNFFVETYGIRALFFHSS